MSDLNFVKIVELINKAKLSGVSISFLNDELVFKVQKGAKVDKLILHELKVNKPYLILYFQKYLKSRIQSPHDVQKKAKYKNKALPLSFAQERLWFIDKLQGSTQYHMHWVFDISGKVNLPALESSFKEVIYRHEVLRTVIKEIDGLGSQYVLKHDEWKLHYISQQHLFEIGHTTESYIQKQVEIPYNLAQDYMLKTSIIQKSEREYTLLILVHHIAFDGWSVSLLMEELSYLYKVLSQNLPVQLQNLPLQYTDYAIWQHDVFESRSSKDKISYWIEKLGDLNPLCMPTDFPRQAIQSTKGNTISYKLHPDLNKNLKDLSLNEGATYFMTLLGAFKVLLYLYTGEKDICIGTPVAGRHQQEFEKLIGFFVNTLVLRSNVDSRETFKTFLQKLRDTTLEAYDHQEIPFEKIVEALNVERDLSRMSLFQILFTMQNNVEVKHVEFEGLTLRANKNLNSFSKFDLDISVSEHKDGLHINISYCTDLFNIKTIERMLLHYENLLTSIVNDIDTPIQRLSYLSESENQTLLAKFNTASKPHGKDKTIIDLFESQVAKTPNAIAVIYEDTTLTYLELNQRANQLGYYLRDLGVREETLVPICLDRGLDMIIGIFGILKAGGAYVPIDPAYPQQRIAYILNDTGCNIVLSSEEYREQLQLIVQGTILTLDIDWHYIADSPKTNLQTRLHSRCLAYVIYTSGSTGLPKGVLIEHVNVVQLFEAKPQIYDFNSDDVWTMFHSFCFDFSVWEMYGALFYGGRLVIVPKIVTQDGTLFADLINRHQITVLNQTPSAFYALQDHIINSGKKLQLRFVIFGGEALNPSRLKRWKHQYTNCRLINMYGITETTVHVTFQEITDFHVESNISIIGKPISTLKVYILNRDLQLIPIGIPGEMFISGAGLGRGYLNQPELTSERFINNPYGTEVESRLYRTGDSARWLPDGSLEFLGRLDNQVKIHGYRIELGEIEEVLRSYLNIDSVKVIVRTDNQGDKELVAYLVGQSILTAAKIRETLAAILPNYMIPSRFIPLKEFPLTLNGKIDMQKMSYYSETEMEIDKSHVAPNSELEEQLVLIWQEILNKDRVSIEDNFFEIGGNSIKIIRLSKLATKLIGKDISVSVLFQYPSIKDLINYLNPETDSIQAETFDRTELMDDLEKFNLG